MEKRVMEFRLLVWREDDTAEAYLNASGLTPEEVGRFAAVVRDVFGIEAQPGPDALLEVVTPEGAGE